MFPKINYEQVYDPVLMRFPFSGGLLIGEYDKLNKFAKDLYYGIRGVLPTQYNINIVYVRPDHTIHVNIHIGHTVWENRIHYFTLNSEFLVRELGKQIGNLFLENINEKFPDEKFLKNNST